MDKDELDKLAEDLHAAVVAPFGDVQKNINFGPTVDIGSNVGILKAGKDPIGKFGKLMEYHEKVPSDIMHPILDITQWKAKHQSLIVVFTCATADATFKNRSSRFCTSLNLHDTMKADVVSLSDGNFYEGLQYTGNHPGGIATDKIHAQAGAWGYNQCIIVAKV